MSWEAWIQLPRPRVSVPWIHQKPRKLIIEEGRVRVSTAAAPWIKAHQKPRKLIRNRADNFEPLWVSTAAAPWVSTSFLRCIQTAYEVVSALCSVDDDPTVMSSNGIVSLDPSKVKVSIEYGLSEMLNREAIRHSLAPKERIRFGIHFSCHRFRLGLTPSPVDMSSLASICRCRIITDDRSVISSDLSPYSTPSSVEKVINLLPQTHLVRPLQLEFDDNCCCYYNSWDPFVESTVYCYGSKRLPYPSRAFDMAHCSRCLIPWNQFGGIYLIEVDRVLRPGGYWILSGRPINWKRHAKGWQRTTEDLNSEQTSIENVAKSLCWEKIKEKDDIAVWQKPINHMNCKPNRTPFCPVQDPDKAWYTELETCLTRLPEVSSNQETAGGELAKWPERLNY